MLDKETNSCIEGLEMHAKRITDLEDQVELFVCWK